MKKIKIHLEKFITIICLSALILALLPQQTLAVTINGKELKPEFLISADECKTVLTAGDPKRKIKGFEPELKEFMEFLDSNFKNKSSTSSLTSLAIARYKEYRDSLRNQFKYVQTIGVKAAEEGSILDFESQVKKYAICGEIVETYISLGRQEMLKHIKKNAAQKKTLMLLEKLKAINVKMRNLNMKIAELSALFKTFREKFPGFSPKSCMKSLF